MKCNSGIKVIYETAWDGPPLCILDYEHIFSLKFPLKESLERSYTHQSISISIYLHKDGEMGYKGNAKDNGKLRILSLDWFLIKCLIKLHGIMQESLSYLNINIIWNGLKFS